MVQHVRKIIVVLVHMAFVFLMNLMNNTNAFVQMAIQDMAVRKISMIV